MASLEGVSLQFTAGDRTLLSSVGGFSQPSKKQIRSLQQLLEFIRPLGLEFYQGHTLEEQKFLGEGISYKVFKCLQRHSGRVFAVKQIKLPSVSSQSEFDRQVACVTRDIEVMSHGTLAGHENVLNILGYGWNFRGSGSIPFLVTEFASGGTLRDYLRTYRLPSRDRLLLCVNVARGLHELHLCGIVHGDLKLDNVLVTPHGPQDPSASAPSVVAKISDFGHSLLLYEDDEAKDDQKYGGTLAYNAPEISKAHGADYISLNFRKCDVWALGLLCWESLDNGSPYYKSERMQELIALHKTDSRSASLNSAGQSKGSAGTSKTSGERSKGTASTTESILGSLPLLADRLQEAALDFLQSGAVEDLYSSEKGKIRKLFRATLDVEPDKRVADIPMLPLLLKTRAERERTRLGQVTKKSAEWSFEVFSPIQMARIPYHVKQQILNDCVRLGSESGRSIASAKAAVHLSLAHLVGFGTEVDVVKSLEWVSKANFKGLQIASTLLELVGETFVSDSTPDSRHSQQRYTRIIRESLRKLDVPYLDATPSTTNLTYTELKQIQAEHERENLGNDIATPFYLPHYAVLYGLTSSLQTSDLLDLQAHSTGDTALLLACQFGDIRAVYNLLALGASPHIPALDGCLPIHFLCMFPPEVMKYAAFLLLADVNGPLLDMESPLSETTLDDLSISNADFPNDQGSLGSPNSIEYTTRRTFPLPNALQQHEAEQWFITAKGIGRGFTEQATTVARRLDPQLPLRLIGTPLAFAVAVASQEAVKILLFLGFSPTAGMDASPIHIAASLHLVKVLKLLLRQTAVSIINDLLKGKGYNNESNEIKGMECIRSVWQSLAKSSLIERTFIHGRHMVQAVRDMTALLSGVSIEAFPSKPMIDNAHVILTAIRVGDLTIADAGTAKLQKSTVEHKISEDDKNLLMLSCTITACSGAFSNLEAFQLLEFALSRGCSIDCNLGGATGPRPVITAIEHQRGDILDFFIERGANVNLRDDQGKCPLHYLVRSELSTTYPVTKLLDAGADVNAREIPGNTSRTSENSDSSTVDTPLILAIKALKLEEAKLLIRDPSIDPTILSGGYSPLHWAVKTGRLDLVSLVIEMPNKSGQSRQTTDTGRGALLRQRDKDGNTPMLLAALGGKVKLVEYFLDKGADLTATNYSGFSCLHCAAYGLHTELLEFLVGKMDPNSSAAPPFESPHEVEFEGEIIGVSSTNSSCTAYRYEAALNLVVKQRSAKLVAPYTACCTILIKAGADPTIPDETGSNPLEIIGRRIEELDEAQSNNVRRSLLEAMVKKGVDLNYMSDGRTWRSCLLHQALNEVDVALVQDLLELGANPEIVNTSSEMTPLRRCASVGPKTSFAMPGALLEKFCKIASLLIAAGADIYERDAERLTLLACAVVEENGPMVHLLLGHFKSMIDLDSLDAESSAGPAKDNSQIPQASLSMPTSKKKGGMRASMLKTIKSAAKPKQDVPVLDTRPARSKVMLERRFRGMSAINREIILDAWRLATSRNRWDVISAFIDQDLHGDTESLKMPTGLALLRYALDQEIGSVLIKFMGKTEGHLSDEMEMDPHLADIWAWVCGWPRSRREVDLGQHLLARCDQFIKAKGFVPMLDLSALQGKGYWEGYTFGGEGGTMKEAIPTEGPTSTPVVYNIFASENFEETEEEMQVQAQLDSLLGGWRGKLGQRSRDG